MKQKDFIVGKWYNTTNDKSFIRYIKYHHTTDERRYNSIWYTQRIYNGDYLVGENYIANTQMEKSMILSDMIEVSKFLPDSHPDKIVGLPEEYIVDCSNSRKREGLECSEEIVKYYYKIDRMMFHWNFIACIKQYDGTEDKIKVDNFEHPRFNDVRHLPIFTYKQWIKLKEIKNINNMKVEVPKTFAITSESKYLKQAFQEELKGLGYTIAYEQDLAEPLINNICDSAYKAKEYTLKDYSRMVNFNGRLTSSDITFTLPQDYTKAIEYAKSAIKSEYWKENKKVTLEDLIEEAKVRYPIGTKFRTITDDDTYIVKGNDFAKWEVAEWNNSITLYETHTDGLIYNEETGWAEVVGHVTVLPFGELMVEIDKTKDYVMISEGKIYKKDLAVVVKWYEGRPKLLGYPIDFKDNGTLKCNFGCKSGTLTELIDIYRAM